MPPVPAQRLRYMGGSSSFSLVLLLLFLTGHDYSSLVKSHTGGYRPTNRWLVIVWISAINPAARAKVQQYSPIRTIEGPGDLGQS